MIKIIDASLLAYTKLREHKVLTSLTILLASLLFGVLISASLVITGALKSVDNFRKDGLTSRYIVEVSNAPGDPLAFHKLLRDPQLLAAAKQRYANLVANKTAEAKRLGVGYNQASDQPPYHIGSDGSESLVYNDQNGIVQQLLEEKFKNQPAFDDAKLQAVAHQYHAKTLFQSENYSPKRGTTLVVLPKTGEKFINQSDEEALDENTATSDFSDLLSLSPSNISTPFMLPHNAGWTPASGSLPIILPQNTIEQMLGFDKLPATASWSDKLARLKVVRSKAATLTFRACYRNQASQSLIQQTIQQQQDIATHKNDKNYQMPSLIYQLPDAHACSNPVIKTDTRTPAEKQSDANQAIFDKEFNGNPMPISYFIDFKVVGVSPAQQDSSDQKSQTIRNMNDIVNGLLATSGVGQTIPASLYSQMPNKEKYADVLTYTPSYLLGNEDNKQRYVEFSRASDATKFIDNLSCTMQYDNTCQPAGRPYQATLAFSNSAAIDDVRSKIHQWFDYAVIGVAVLAAIIMWIAISRTIADSRHETAVFRAIGFKRFDILQIYSIYACLLSALVVLLSVAIGFLCAFIVNQWIGPNLTMQAQYSFGGLDLSKRVDLISANWQQIGMILLVCFAAGLCGALIPLLRNIRRNPIRDLREE